MSNPAKVLRHQLKDIVKDALPGVLNEALVQAVYDKVIKAIQPQLAKLEKDVKTTLDTIDQRSKDSLGYLVRQVTEVSQPKVGETTPKKE